MTPDAVYPTLAECEQVIERYELAYQQAGEALRLIRDGRLYKAEFSDFDSYCRDRWGFDRKRASRLIAAAGVAAQLSPMGDTPIPSSERQARALAPLKDDPEAMAAAMAAASADGKATAAKIAAAVDRKLQAAQQMQVDAQADADEFASMQPDDFDPALNKELIRQRGELTRLCRDLVAIGDTADFLARHEGHLRPDIYHKAEAARDWLIYLCDQWRSL